jgi:hypothetical protein
VKLLRNFFTKTQTGRRLQMNMTFISQWLQLSQFVMAALMMFALMTLPMTPLWAQESNRKTDGESNSGVFPEGTYLYGQSPQADQIGQEYIVFEVSQGELVGALYMPHSEFSCFQGEITANQLEMLVDHPYDDTTHSHAIALESTSPIASRDGQGQELTIQGYHALEEISANDQRMLATCKKEMR